MIKGLLNQLEEVNAELFDILSSVEEQQFNTAPAPNSWSAAQVGAHLIKSDEWMLSSLYGPGKKTERPVDAGVEGLQKVLLDFASKLKSPKEIIPANDHYAKEVILDKLENTRKRINEAVMKFDLNETYSGTALGEVTGFELVNFVIYHTKRHVHQLQKIASAVAV